MLPTEFWQLYFCSWRWLWWFKVFHWNFSPLCSHIRFWSYTSTTCASSWRLFYLIYSDSVKIIKEHVFITIALTTKNIDIIIHHTTCVTVSSLWNIANLLALYPPKKFWFLRLFVEVRSVLRSKVKASLPYRSDSAPLILFFISLVLVNFTL